MCKFVTFLILFISINIETCVVLSNLMDEPEDQNIRSKFFIKLIFILEERRHQHMIWLVEKNKFRVKMVDKKNKAWEDEDISLFKELDFLYERDKHLANYPGKCKTRFKSNISKLCASNYLKTIEPESEKISTSVTIKTYEILKFLPDVRFFKSDVLKKRSLKSMKKKKKMVHLHQCSTSASYHHCSKAIARDTSHFSCLSQNNFIIFKEGEQISEMELSVDLKDESKTNKEGEQISEMESSVDLKDESKTDKEGEQISEMELSVDLKDESKTDKLQMMKCNLKSSVDPLLSSAGDISKWNPDTDLNINEDDILNTFKANGTVFNPINKDPDSLNPLLLRSQTDLNLNIDDIFKAFQTSGIAFDWITEDLLDPSSNGQDDISDPWLTAFDKIPEEEQK